MTKLATDFVWPAPIPGWDLMKWKDETQAAILRETEGMTDDDVLEYFRKESEEFRKELAERRTKKQLEQATG